MAEMNASNEVIWAWINGPGLDQPVERIAFIHGTPRNRQVVHADGLGSVSALSDESGTPVQTYDYAAFGGVRAQTGADLNRITYTAREALGDSLGFQYYRHRVYDPNTGRFTSEDPLGFVDGVSRYVYVGNNPINWIDIWGLEKYTGPKIRPDLVAQARLLHEQLYGPDSSCEDHVHKKQKEIYEVSDYCVDTARKAGEYALDPFGSAITDSLDQIPGGKLYNEGSAIREDGIKDWGIGKIKGIIYGNLYEGIKSLTRWPDDRGINECKE